MAEYGYKSPIEIQTNIDNKKPLYLDGCFTSKIDFQVSDLQYFKAAGGLFNLNTMDLTFMRFRIIAICSDKAFLGDVHFHNAKFYCEAVFSYVNCVGEIRFTEATIP